MGDLSLSGRTVTTLLACYQDVASCDSMEDLWELLRGMRPQSPDSLQVDEAAAHMDVSSSLSI